MIKTSYLSTWAKKPITDSDDNVLGFIYKFGSEDRNIGLIAIVNNGKLPVIYLRVDDRRFPIDLGIDGEDDLDTIIRTLGIE